MTQPGEVKYLASDEPCDHLEVRFWCPTCHHAGRRMIVCFDCGGRVEPLEPARDGSVAFVGLAIGLALLLGGLLGALGVMVEVAK